MAGDSRPDSATSRRVRWGILGTGNTANAFAQSLGASSTGQLVAVGSRQQGTADAFEKKFPGTRKHASYSALIGDPDVEAVYVSTPIPFHASLCIAAARAGKHIVCEKSFTSTAAEAELAAAAARENDVFLMEAFFYRFSPQFRKACNIIASGTLGDIGTIISIFGISVPYDPEMRLFQKSLGGGTILEGGCYPMSIARMTAGIALGRAFAEPLKVMGAAKILPESGTEIYAVASMEFPNGILAQISAAVRLQEGPEFSVYGSKGSLHMGTFWDVRDPIVVKLNGEKPVTHEAEPSPDLPPFTLEADAAGAAILEGKHEVPEMSVADSIGNMRALDAWCSSAGIPGYGS